MIAGTAACLVGWVTVLSIAIAAEPAAVVEATVAKATVAKATAKIDPAPAVEKAAADKKAAAVKKAKGDEKAAEGGKPLADRVPVVGVPVVGVPIVKLVPVSLPIVGTVDADVIRVLTRVVETAESRGLVDPRPLVVLAFRAESEELSADSEFERSLALARFLTSEPMRRVRTVAYIEKSVTGHAVLPVLACEELLIAKAGLVGDAGAQVNNLDETLRTAYLDLARRRLTVPAAVVAGMLEPAVAVQKIKTDGKTQIVLDAELRELEKTQPVTETETVKPAGSRGLFTGSDLRVKLGVPCRHAEDLAEVARVLQVSPTDLHRDPGLEGNWRPLRVDLTGRLQPRRLTWIKRQLELKLAQDEFNLLYLVIDSSGGAPVESVELASFLMGLPERVQTVGVVSRTATSDAALLALACRQTVMYAGAKLGGGKSAAIREPTLGNLKVAIRDLGQRRPQGPAALIAMLEPELPLKEIKHLVTGQVRLVELDEWERLPDREQWAEQRALTLADGLSPARARELGITQLDVDSFPKLLAAYQNDGEPQQLRPTWAHLLVDRLASPALAWLLLSIAFISLGIEISSPGWSGAGLLSALCFTLFFWSRYLQGTAEWLEILLFFLGVICLALEIFVIPGFGLFGISGILMMVISLVLASQTFIFPRNAFEVEQLATSLGTVAAGASVTLVALYLLRHYLSRSSRFRRFVLESPTAEQIQERSRRESLVDRTNLLGMIGRTTTRLAPSGKARFGDDLVDVITAGEMIAADQPIVVRHCQGNRVIVELYGTPAQA
jgi:membrane-bound ClpP family serine protease